MNDISSSQSQMETQDMGGTVDSTSSEHFTSSDENANNKATVSIWGRLFPLNNHVTSVDLSKSCHTFGREVICDFVFPKFHLSSVISKLHFKLTRELPDGEIVILEDFSRNGTFINEKKVGAQNKRILRNNDVISIANPKEKLFHFVDLKSKEDDNIDQVIRNRFTVCNTLGSGSYGEVRKVFEIVTCHKYAIKIISKVMASFVKNQNDSSNFVMNEATLMKELQHPCIIKVEDVIDTEKYLYIVLELIEGGELFERIDKRGKLSESASKVIFYQLLLAIQYLHNKGITHRDLKPENVLLVGEEDETLIKVTDFGISKLVDDNTMLKTFCGTPNYLAPEIIRCSTVGPYTNAIDCWSLGVVLHCCLVGYQPFVSDTSETTLYQKICDGKIEFPDKYWENISEEAQNLVRGLLQVKPEDRLTIAEALDHPWLKDDEMLGKVQKLMNENAESFRSSSSCKRSNEDGESTSESDSLPESSKKIKTT